MKTRWILLAGVVTCAEATALLAACATNDTAVGAADPAQVIAPPGPPLPADAEADVTADAEVDACVDCEFFPETCSDDVLCQDGPFDSNVPGGLDPRTQINVVRGRSASDVWAVGALGAMAHFDGTSWTRSNADATQSMLALWLRGSSEISLGTLDTIYTRGLDAPDAGPPSDGGWISRTGPVAPSDVVNVLARFTYAWGAEGGDWLWCTTTAIATGFTEGLRRVRISPSTGEFEIQSVLPYGICSSLPCSQLTNIHGFGSNDIWAVGMKGSAVRIGSAESDSPTMKVFNTQTWNALNGVWAESESEAWAVGAQGTIRRYRGDPVLWDVVTNVPTNGDLRAVWGSSSSDVWAVGDDALVLHWDGTSWSRVKIAGLRGRRPNLTTVWTSAPGHVWIGGQGVILSLGGKP